jgi:heat shock protein HslJ
MFAAVGAVVAVVGAGLYIQHRHQRQVAVAAQGAAAVTSLSVVGTWDLWGVSGLVPTPGQPLPGGIVEFRADGTFKAVPAGCNVYSGTWTLTGRNLTVLTSGTLMACAGVLRELEAAFTGRLAKPLTVEATVGDPDTIDLKTTDGLIVLRRPGATTPIPTAAAPALTSYLAKHPELVKATPPVAVGARIVAVAATGPTPPVTLAVSVQAVVLEWGDGTWQSAATFSIGQVVRDEPRPITYGDVTGDGHPDFLLPLATNWPIATVISDQTGTWTQLRVSRPAAPDNPGSALGGPQDVVLGVNPRIENGAQLVTDDRECIPDCARGRLLPVHWQWDPATQTLRSDVALGTGVFHASAFADSSHFHVTTMTIGG